jgi:hypothetical protein
MDSLNISQLANKVGGGGGREEFPMQYLPATEDERLIKFSMYKIENFV